MPRLLWTGAGQASSLTIAEEQSSPIEIKVPDIIIAHMLYPHQSDPQPDFASSTLTPFKPLSLPLPLLEVVLGRGGGRNAG